MVMQQPQPLVGVRILVVEDAAELALSLSEGLRRAGAVSVEIKASARQARKRLMQLPVPDLALLDYNLTGDETGLDIALWMREQPALLHTRRILYSASDFNAVRELCPDAEVFHAMIPKPVSLPFLIDKLSLFMTHQMILK